MDDAALAVVLGLFLRQVRQAAQGCSALLRSAQGCCRGAGSGVAGLAGGAGTRLCVAHTRDTAQINSAAMPANCIRIRACQRRAKGLARDPEII